MDAKWHMGLMTSAERRHRVQTRRTLVQYSSEKIIGSRRRRADSVMQWSLTTRSRHVHDGL